MASTDDFTDLDFDTGSDEFNFDNMDSMDFNDGSREPSPWSPSEVLKSALRPEVIRDAGRVLNRKGIGTGYAKALDAADEARSMGRDLYDSTYESMRGDIESTKNVLRQISKTIADKAVGFLPEWVTNKLIDFSKKPESGWDSSYIDPAEAAIQSATLSVFSNYAATSQQQLEHSVESGAQLHASTEGLREDTRKGLGNLSENIAKLVAYQDNVTLNYHKKTLEIQLRTFFETKELVKVTKASALTTAEKLAAIQKNTSLPDFAKLTLSENSSLILQNKLIGGLQDKFLGYFSGTGDKVKKALGKNIKDFLEPLFSTFGSLDGQLDMLLGEDAQTSPSAMIRDALVEMLMTQGVSIATDKLVTPKMKEMARQRGVSEEEVLTYDKRLEYITETFGGNLEDIATGRSNTIPLGTEELINKAPKFIKDLAGKFAPRDLTDTQTGEVLLTSKQLASGKYTDVLTGKPVKSFKDITGPVVDEYGLEVISSEQFKTPKRLKEVRRTYAEDGSDQTNMFADIIREYYDKPKNSYATPKSLMETATDSTEFDLMTRRSIVEVIPGYLSRILEQMTTLVTGKPAERMRYDAEAEGFVGDKELFTRYDKKLFAEGSIQNRRNDVHKLIEKMDKDKKLTPEEKSALADQMIDDFDSGASTWNMSRYSDITNIRMSDRDLGQSIAEKLKTYQHTGVEDLALNNQWRGLRRLDADIRKELAKYAATGDTEKLREIGLLIRKNGKLVVNNEYIRQRLRGEDPKNFGHGEGDNTPPTGPGGLPPDDEPPSDPSDPFGLGGGDTSHTVEEEWAAAMANAAAEASRGGDTSGDGWADLFRQTQEEDGSATDINILASENAYGTDDLQRLSEHQAYTEKSKLDEVVESLSDHVTGYRRKYNIFKERLLRSSARSGYRAIKKHLNLLLAETKTEKDIERIKAQIINTRNLSEERKKELLKKVDEFTKTDVYRRSKSKFDELLGQVTDSETYKEVRGKIDEFMDSDEAQNAVSVSMELKEKVIAESKAALAKAKEKLAERGITVDTLTNTTLGDALDQGKSSLKSVLNRAASIVADNTDGNEAGVDESTMEKYTRMAKEKVNQAAKSVMDRTSTKPRTEDIIPTSEELASVLTDNLTENDKATVTPAPVPTEEDALAAALSEDLASMSGGMAASSEYGEGEEWADAIATASEQGATTSKSSLRERITEKTNMIASSLMNKATAVVQNVISEPTAVSVSAETAAKSSPVQKITNLVNRAVNRVSGQPTETANVATETTAAETVVPPAVEEAAAADLEVLKPWHQRLIDRAKNPFGKTKTTNAVEEPPQPTVETATAETVSPVEGTEPKTEEKTPSPKISASIGDLGEDPLFALVDTGFSALIDTINKNFMTSHEIMNRGFSGGEGTGSAGGLSTIGSGLLKLTQSASKGAFGLLKTYYEGLSKIASPVASIFSGVAGGLVGGLTAGFYRGMRFAMGKRVNLYLPDREEPVIFARDLDDGRYVNEEDGKDIHEVKDITGAVLDENGEIYLTAEQASALTDRTGRPVTTGIGSLFKNLGRIWNAQTNLIGRALSAPGRLLNAATNFLYRITDVYVRGEDKPRLLAVVMRNGGYVSSATGEPIYDIRKMDSDIKDLHGNTVLSTADAAGGLCDRFGASLAVSNVRRFLSSIYRPMKWLAGKAVQVAKKVVDVNLDVGQRVLKTVGTVGGKILGGAVGTIGGALGYQKIGTSVDGEPDPIIPNILAEQLIYQRKIYEYISSDTRGKGEDTKSDNIEKVEINSLEELKRIRDILSGAAKKDEIAKDSTSDSDLSDDEVVNMNNADETDNRIDTDNDGESDDDVNDFNRNGLRDNSWQEIAQRKAEEKAKENTKDKPKEKEPEKKENGIMSWLMPLIGGIGTTLTSVWGTLKTIGSAIAGYFAWKKAADVAGGIDELIDGPDIDVDAEDGNRRRRGGGRRGGGRGGRRGWVRGAIDKAKGLFRRGPSPAGGAARTGVRAAIGRGAAVAGQVAARAIPLAGAAVTGTAAALGTSAVVAGAVLAGGVVAAGAVAYGGYKLYKHLKYTADLEPIEGLRYLQYGVDLNNKDAVAAIRRLEEAVIDEMEGSGAKAAPGNDSSHYFQEHAEDFNRSIESEEDGQQWAIWYTKRFCPVLFTHIRNLHEVDSSADIDDVDDDLEAKDKIIFIKRVLFNQKDAAQGVNPYAQGISPFPDLQLITDGKVINEYAKQLIDGLLSKVDMEEVDVTKVLSKANELAKAGGGGDPNVKGPASPYKSTLIEKTDISKGVTASDVVFKPFTTLAKTTAASNVTHMGVWDLLTNPFGSVSLLQKTVSLMDRFKTKVLPLEGLRYLQYGSSLEDAEFLAKIRILEELVIKHTTFDNIVPKIGETDQFFYEEMSQLFGLESDAVVDQTEWMTWFRKRFVPIFMIHVGMLRSIDKEVSLFDIDDDLSQDLKKSFVGLVSIHPTDSRFETYPYLVAYRPLFGHGIISDPGIIEAYKTLLLRAITVSEDLDAFDPKMLPQEIEKDPTITMKVYRAREDVNGLESIRQKAEANVVDVNNTPTQQSAPKNQVPPGVKKLTPEQLQGAFVSPVANGTVISKFGQRKHPIKKVMAPHNGVDFAGKTGDPILAANNGMVMRQEKSPSYGNIVYLKHPDGTTTRYAHLHMFPAGQTVGTEVDKGQVIGYMGSTGRSTGPHLHFEVRNGVAQDATPIDPLKKIAPNTLAGGASIKKPEKKEDTNYVDGPPVDVAEKGNTPAATSIPKLSSEAPIKPALSTEEVNKTTASMVSTSAKPAEPTVVQVNGGKDEKILTDILRTQDQGTQLASDQRTKQLKAQEELLKKMDTLINVMSTPEKSKPTSAPAPLPQQVASVTPPTFPKTKTTNPIVDYGH